MGIAGLPRWAKSRAQAAKLNELARGRPMGIDVSVWLHQICVFLPADSRDPAWARAVDGLVRRAMRTVAYGVPIVVVFDCPFTSPAKAEERARRRARAMRAMVDANDLAPSDDDDEGGPAPSDPAAAVINVHGALQDMVWAAMQAAGISCVMSPAEADHQLAALHRLGLIWAALTPDSDLLAMGVPSVVRYEWRTGECFFVDVPFWRPIDTWAAGAADPLHWLVLAYERGGDELARSALLLYACTAASDFNQIPYVGPARAVELVLDALDTLPAYDAVTFRAFLDSRAPAVHKLHESHVQDEQLRRTLEQVRAGMRQALASFTRSIVYDVFAGRERPLELGDTALTAAEQRIVGTLCASDADATALAYGGMTRGELGHTTVSGPTGPWRVIPRGTSEPCEILYTMLPDSVRTLFELSDEFVSQDASPPYGPSRFPEGIPRDTLELFFKCIGERLPRSPQGQSGSTKDLRRGVLLWLRAHRRPLPPLADRDDESDAAVTAALPRFQFEECALRDPQGRGALLLALQRQPSLAAEHVSELNRGASAFPSATSAGWCGGIDAWTPDGPRAVPSFGAIVLASHYQTHYARERMPPLAPGGSFDRDDQCRPMERSLRRVVRMSARPTIDLHAVVPQPDGTGIAWLSGQVAASQTANVLYSVKVAVRCVALPAAAAVAAVAARVSTRSSARAPAAASAVAWLVSEVLWVECPCKQQWNCAHAGSLLWIAILWGVARVKDHMDLNRYGATAVQCWWLGLSAEAIDAHSHQSRSTPAWRHDHSRVRFGPADGAVAPSATVAWAYDPANALDNYPQRNEWKPEALAELFAAVAAADKPAARKPAARRGGGAQVTANEWLYTDGAAEQARALHRRHQSDSELDDD
jgi:hypothetical protein